MVEAIFQSLGTSPSERKRCSAGNVPWLLRSDWRGGQVQLAPQMAEESVKMVSLAPCERVHQRTVEQIWIEFKWDVLLRHMFQDGFSVSSLHRRARLSPSRCQTDLFFGELLRCSKAEGIKVETASARAEFLCQVRVDFNAERHPPTLSPFHEGEKKVKGVVLFPFFFWCAEHPQPKRVPSGLTEWSTSAEWPILFPSTPFVTSLGVWESIFDTIRLEKLRKVKGHFDHNCR